MSNRNSLSVYRSTHARTTRPHLQPGVCGECIRDAGYTRTSGVWEGSVHPSQDSTKHLCVQLVVVHQCLWGNTWRDTPTNDTPIKDTPPHLLHHRQTHFEEDEVQSNQVSSEVALTPPQGELVQEAHTIVPTRRGWAVSH